MVKFECRGLYMMMFVTSFRIVSLTAESVRSASERSFILITIFFTLRPAASQQSRSVNDPPLFLKQGFHFCPAIQNSINYCSIFNCLNSSKVSSWQNLHDRSVDTLTNGSFWKLLQPERKINCCNCLVCLATWGQQKQAVNHMSPISPK